MPTATATADYTATAAAAPTLTAIARADYSGTNTTLRSTTATAAYTATAPQRTTSATAAYTASSATVAKTNVYARRNGIWVAQRLAHRISGAWRDLMDGSIIPTGVSAATATTHLTSIPLAAGDYWHSGPLDMAGRASLTALSVSDQPHTMTIEMSTDGVTFTAAGSVSSAASGADQNATLTAGVTGRYARIAVTCGATSMSRLSVDAQIPGA